MWVQIVFTESLSQVELSKFKRASDTLTPSLVRCARRLFFFPTRFLCSILASEGYLLLDGPPSKVHIFASQSLKRYTTPSTLSSRPNPRKHDPTCTYARSRLPVIYLFRIRHPSHSNSHSSTTSLEQTGSPSMLYSSLFVLASVLT